MCFVWIFIVIIETQCVYCAVRNRSLREMQVTLLEGTSRLRKNFTFYTGSKRNSAVAYLFQHRHASTMQKTLATLANRPVDRHHQAACNSTQTWRSALGKHFGREYQLVYRIKWRSFWFYPVLHSIIRCQIKLATNSVVIQINKDSNCENKKKTRQR
jgi:uncharacterized protein (DUF2252 family)